MIFRLYPIGLVCDIADAACLVPTEKAQFYWERSEMVGNRGVFVLKGVTMCKKCTICALWGESPGRVRGVEWAISHSENGAGEKGREFRRNLTWLYREKLIYEKKSRNMVGW